MSPVTQLSVLAFAAGAYAVHGHHGVHNHPHRSGSASGSGMPFPYPEANATGLWGTTGTGLSTGTASPNSASASSGGPPTVYVSPIPATSSPSSSASFSTYYNNAASDSTTTCTTDVTVTTTERTYVTVTAGEESSSSSVAVSATDLSTSNGQVTSHVTVHSTIYASASGPIASANSSSASYSASAPVYSAASLSSASSSAASSSASSSSSTADANSQSQAQKYPTWHRSSSSADATSSSVYVAPSSSSSSAYVAPSSSSVYVAPSSSSVYIAPTTSSVWVAPTTSSSSAWVAPTTSSSSASAPSYSSAPSTGGKRGLAYNDVSLTSAFGGSAHVGWGYNWASSSGGLSSSLNYIPLLWGTRSDFTSVWAKNAQAAIDAGSTHLMSFNEPDLSTQANMSPQDAASAWKQYMEPFAGKAKLCAPAVTNGGGEMGLTWLSNFLNACQGCTIDCVSIHWYASHTLADYFKEQVTNATTVSGGKPVFVSEFATTDGSNDEISTFLQDVMPWMDSNNDVAGYAYFMVSNGMLMSGNGMSPYGSTYATYSS